MTNHNLHSEKGFSLIELMIVVAIIGILAAVAIPAYISHFRKARQADGIHRLMDIKTAQEKYYALNDEYATDLATLASLVNFDSTDTSMFQFTITHPNDPQTDFLVTSANNLDQDGDPEPINGTFTDCWKIANIQMDMNGDGDFEDAGDHSPEPKQVTDGGCLEDGEGVNISLVNF